MWLIEIKLAHKSAKLILNHHCISVRNTCFNTLNGLIYNYNRAINVLVNLVWCRREKENFYGFFLFLFLRNLLDFSLIWSWITTFNNKIVDKMTSYTVVVVLYRCNTLIKRTGLPIEIKNYYNLNCGGPA